MVQVRKDVNHVIAPGETKLFQGRLQRKSAGSSQPGADHLDWHRYLTIGQLAWELFTGMGVRSIGSLAPT